MATGPVWRTCLRTIEFLDADAHERPRGEVVLEDAEAYGFLLEVVCGLRSPLAGETQVHGQFKAFADSLHRVRDGQFHRLAQDLLADAKTVREAHLRGLGSRSYGTAVRRQVRDCERIALIGAGALASEVRQYLLPEHPVDQWSRRQHDEAPAGTDAEAAARLTWRSLVDGWRTPAGPVALDAAAVIVAAPADPDVIAAVCAQYPSLRRVIDLRGEAERTPLAVGVPIVTLADIFEASGEARDRARHHVDRARRDIAARARAWMSRAELHPHGWEDVCA